LTHSSTFFSSKKRISYCPFPQPVDVILSETVSSSLIVPFLSIVNHFLDIEDTKQLTIRILHEKFPLLLIEDSLVVVFTIQKLLDFCHEVIEICSKVSSVSKNAQSIEREKEDRIWKV
jgi:hypothetical protein